MLGSKSGFDAIEDCYVDLADHIFALETGLSSDPGMNWRISGLDRYRLVSNSDAHSPPMLGREATVFDTDLDYFAIRRALETGIGHAGSVEFFPEEGKYHVDGHRKCGVRMEPQETREHGGVCPEYGKPPAPRSGFAGFRFPSDVLMVAVRWYLRYGLSYRDVEELLAERGVEVDHVSVFRWVQRFTPLLIDAARPCRHTPGDRWFVDETYVKVGGRWVYLYRAIGQFGQVIEVLVAEKRDLAATRRFFTRAREHSSCRGGLPKRATPWTCPASACEVGREDGCVDVEALRAQTPGCAHRVHLNNAGAALLAQPTLDAMIGHLRLEAEIGGYEAAAVAQDGIRATYDSIADLVGGRSDEVALFDNATHAWNAAFYSVPLGPGDQILTGRAEYGSNVLAYLQVAQRTGAEVVVVPNDHFGQLDTAALAELVGERTKLIGVTHVPTSGGLVNPAAEIGRIARDTGALFLLDATQSVGQFPVDVEAIGADLVTGTGRKFLRGPRGTGFLWVRRTVLDRLDPYVAEIRSANWTGARGFAWVDGARRFESWENSYVNVLGLGAAVREALHLGLDVIGERTRGLGARLRHQLNDVPGVSTYDLGEVRCAIVTARVHGVPAADVAATLGHAGVNVTTTVPQHTQFDTEDRGVHPLVRFSPHYYNTQDELDRAVELVAGLTS